MCVVCGVDNGLGLQGHFYELAGGEVAGIFQPRPEHQGYPGRMHGGLASAILDETIGRAINIREPDTWGVTVEFTVRFRKPVPLDAPVKAIGRLTGDPRRLFEGSGEILLADGTVAAGSPGQVPAPPSVRHSRRLLPGAGVVRGPTACPLRDRRLALLLTLAHEPCRPPITRLAGSAALGGTHDPVAATPPRTSRAGRPGAGHATRACCR